MDKHTKVEPKKEEQEGEWKFKISKDGHRSKIFNGDKLLTPYNLRKHELESICARLNASPSNETVKLTDEMIAEKIQEQYGAAQQWNADQRLAYRIGMEAARDHYEKPNPK